MSTQLPPQAKKYFWGDDLDELNWDDHRSYIMQTLLDKGDVAAIAWLFNQVTTEEILEVLPKLKMSHKSRNFWQVYLS